MVGWSGVEFIFGGHVYYYTNFRFGGALFGGALCEVIGGALCEVIVVDGAFERPVEAIEFGSDGVGDGLAEGVGDVVDVFVVGAVGAVAGRSREVVIVRVIVGAEGVGDGLCRVVVEKHVEHVGRVVDAVGRCEHVGVVDGEGECEFGFGFGGECNCIHVYIIQTLVSH